MTTTSPKVFGVGLGRTGTASLTLAFRKLGYRATHFLPYADLIEEFLVDEKVFFGPRTRAFIEKFDAISNGTGMPFQQLDRLYPDSRFVLTLRDPDRWLSSQESFRAALAERAARSGTGQIGATSFINKWIYGEEVFDPVLWANAFERQRDNVFEYFRDTPERLLTLDIAAGDGWAKLCTFLDQPIVEGPFPHSNDQGSVLEDFRLQETLRNTISRLGIGSRPFVLADMGYGDINTSTAVPFPSRNGIWWGNPESADAAVREMRQRCIAGAEFVVFTWATFWYLDKYRELADLLRRAGHEIYSGADCVVYKVLRDGDFA